MVKINLQQGIGLIEVLVAVLLLAIAILGFSAMQMQALDSTDDSLIMTKALNISKNIAETIRAYPNTYVEVSGNNLTTILVTQQDKFEQAVPTIQAVAGINSDSVTVDNKAIDKDSCVSSKAISKGGKKVPEKECNINQLAVRDILMIKSLAANENIALNIITCPDTDKQVIQQQLCLVTAWNTTKPILDDSDAQACANANGSYKRGNDCLIMESY